MYLFFSLRFKILLQLLLIYYYYYWLFIDVSVLLGDTKIGNLVMHCILTLRKPNCNLSDYAQLNLVTKNSNSTGEQYPRGTKSMPMADKREREKHLAKKEIWHWPTLQQWAIRHWKKEATSVQESLPQLKMLANIHTIKCDVRSPFPCRGIQSDMMNCLSCRLRKWELYNGKASIAVRAVVYITTRLCS